MLKLIRKQQNLQKALFLHIYLHMHNAEFRQKCRMVMNQDPGVNYVHKRLFDQVVNSKIEHCAAKRHPARRSAGASLYFSSVLREQVPLYFCLYKD